MDQCCGVCIECPKAMLFEVSLPENIPCVKVIATVEKILESFAVFLSGTSLMESTHICVLLWTEGLQRLEHQSSLMERVLYVFAGSVSLMLMNTFDTVLAADIYEGE